MKLVAATVKNFRSVEDSEQFTLDEIACLVGKNEAGKSAILQALAGVNPHPAAPFEYNKERDYPRRHLTKYDERHEGGAAPVAITEWSVSDEAKALITDEFGEDAVMEGTLTITSGYGGKSIWTMPINREAAVEHILTSSNLSASELAQARAAVAKSTKNDQAKALREIEGASEKLAALAAKLDSFSGDVLARVRSLWEPLIPRFMYFSNYDRMAGEVQIEQLQDRNQMTQLRSDERRSLELFQDFLSFAGTSVSEIIAAKTYETFNARLKAASNTVTDEIFEYWTQNPFLSVEVTVGSAKPGDPPPLNSGTIARARVYNSIHRVDVPFSERSAGFVWFFSFLVKFAQVKDDEVPVILLLDEPGLTLHGKAQADLLRFFREKLAPHHQLIYSTHSPFMVDPERLTSARIVEDAAYLARGNKFETQGTKVRDDVLGKDPDTVFPLQGALGYEITQTLFVGKHTLLVEGPSDVLYLQALSAALKRKGRTGLDPRWTMCPTGGIGNIKPFVSLFKGSEMNIAVLADYASGQKKLIESLRSSTILETGSVVTLNEATGKAEADVEDLLDPDLFVDLVNATYSLTGDNRLTAETLDVAHPSERLVQKAEAYFRTLPDTIPTYDHYSPSEWLLIHPNILDESAGCEATLAKAEPLFTRLNGLLKV
ncbi:AAA family ATPase [Croceicoccus sp. YJ47]|uniref:AAA family ATPase n=1 Tax=Croceicoccus sp. YJ47 TaxID=2798724 RepID=UPI001923340C|nr:AAA family ATPase [Croceicoccus sp. YJ47]QQN73618.1 AAA family ATPase [Croceicoccus sp. YJ47]